jgi:DNA-directed RNA polymerase specialized sigma24 family protein
MEFKIAARACRPRPEPEAVDPLKGPMRFVDGGFYGEMCRAAHRLLRTETTGHPFDACDLVNEALLRIMSAGKCVIVRNRAHLAAIGVTTMRRVLVDYFRTSDARANGPGQRVPLDTDLIGESTDRLKGYVVRLSLERLAVVNHRSYLVVLSHFFLGLSIDQTAIRLGVCSRTVKRDWRGALDWLCEEVGIGCVPVAAGTITSSRREPRRPRLRPAHLVDAAEAGEHSETKTRRCVDRTTRNNEPKSSSHPCERGSQQAANSRMAEGA